MMRPTHVGDPNLPFEEQWRRVALYFGTRGMQLPNDYLVLDIETDGFSPTQNSILQIGYALVLKGLVKNQGGVYIETPEADLQAYENGFYVRKQKAAGNDGYIKAADVRQHGQPRDQVFALLRRLIEDVMKNFPGSFVVGHNLVGFDQPFIEYFSAKCGQPIAFDKTRLFDTGVMFKANKLGMLPRDGDSLYEFLCHVRDIRAKGVLWSLSTACKELDLEKKHGLDLSQAHDAAADTLFTHYVYQALRDQFAAVAAQT